MAGHGGAKGHFSGGMVADFADQNDVRILAHDGTDAIYEIQFGRFVD